MDVTRPDTAAAGRGGRGANEEWTGSRSRSSSSSSHQPPPPAPGGGRSTTTRRIDPSWILNALHASPVCAEQLQRQLVIASSHNFSHGVAFAAVAACPARVVSTLLTPQQELQRRTDSRGREHSRSFSSLSRYNWHTSVLPIFFNFFLDVKNSIPPLSRAVLVLGTGTACL